MGQLWQSFGRYQDQAVRDCDREGAKHEQTYYAIGNSQLGHLNRTCPNRPTKLRDGHNSHDRAERKDSDDPPR